MAATSPMKGGTTEMRNQSRNELPFMRPMVPPARPKENAMITNAMAGGPSLEQRADRPDDGDDRDDDRDEPGDRHGDSDDRLEQEPGSDREHGRRDEPH